MRQGIFIDLHSVIHSFILSNSFRSFDYNLRIIYSNLLTYHSIE